MVSINVVVFGRTEDNLAEWKNTLRGVKGVSFALSLDRESDSKLNLDASLFYLTVATRVLEKYSKKRPTMGEVQIFRTNDGPGEPPWVIATLGPKPPWGPESSKEVIESIVHDPAYQFDLMEWIFSKAFTAIEEFNSVNESKLCRVGVYAGIDVFDQRVVSEALKQVYLSKFQMVSSGDT
jgi:hypothetical protein